MDLGNIGCGGMQWDRLGRYTQGMVVYLPWVEKRRIRVGRHAE